MDRINSRLTFVCCPRLFNSSEISLKITSAVILFNGVLRDVLLEVRLVSIFFSIDAGAVWALPE